MNSGLIVNYFAFSEKYGGEHAGFTHSYNISKNLARLCKKFNLFLSSACVGVMYSNKNFTIHGVIFPKLNAMWKIISYLRSYFYVKMQSKEVDIVHERFHVNPVDLLFVRGKVYVLEVNDPAMVLHDNFLYRYLIKLKFKKCDCIITQTETLREILVKYTDKPIYVVPNGVDTQRFKPNIESNVRLKYNIKSDKIIVLFIGAFMQWHGVHYISKLAKKYPEVIFMLVGDGPEYDIVSRMASRVNNLILVGSKPQREIPKFLAAADITIAPFSTEKFKELDNLGFWWCPVKLFEYMAAGKPVVSYDYREVRNIVRSGGLLAKVGDFEDFVIKLGMLINNNKLRLALGGNARKIALGYDWKYRANEIYGVYRKCLES